MHDDIDDEEGLVKDEHDGDFRLGSVLGDLDPSTLGPDDIDDDEETTMTGGEDFESEDPDAGDFDDEDDIDEDIDEDIDGDYDDFDDDEELDDFDDD